MKTYWQQETLYFDAESYFHALVQDIEQAKNSLALETYIFNRDATGEKIITALLAAHHRGVSIRVLIDAIGSREHGEEIASQLEQAGIEVRIFRPLPWRFGTHRWALLQGEWHKKLFNFFWRINKRNHRKLCVIDGKIAWVGSFNITDDHFGSDGIAWKDLAARVCDDNVDKLQQSFDQIWRRIDTKNRYRRVRNFFSNHSRYMRMEKNAALINLIYSAKVRVWITNAYFSPSHSLLKALRDADQRGVSVQIIVPQKSDLFFFPALSSTYYADLLKAGVRIYEYGARILHEKSMLIDNKAIIGSTNLNYRSFFHDLELDVLLNQAKTIRDMEYKFIDELKLCQEITVPRLQQYPPVLLMLGWLARILRYWL